VQKVEAKKKVEEPVEEAFPEPEPEPVEAVEVEVVPEVTPAEEPDEIPEPETPLKRQGTYEVLPMDENDEGKENNYVPDSPQASDGEEEPPKAVRPTTLERPDGSRLPVIDD
jgi:hypothetical protein